MSAVELEDPLGHVVEEVAVVGYRDDGAGIFLEIALEPGNRFRIQMVGGFVEQQHVGRGQQQLAQRHAALLATGELADDGIPVGQAQRIGGDVELAFHFPAVGGVDGVLQFGLLLEQRVHLVIRHGFGELLADGVEAGEPLEFIAEAAHHRLAHGVGVVQLRFLLQIADADTGLRARFAVDVGIDAGHDLQQRGFARAVQAEHADLGAREEGEGDVAKDGPLGRHNLRNAIHGVDVLSHGAMIVCPSLERRPANPQRASQTRAGHRR